MIPRNLSLTGPKKAKEEPTKNPWYLETVKNGLKATNVHEHSAGIMPNRRIPVQYFEYDRIYGQGAFQSALKVMDMFEELRSLTPKTKGFIFGEYKYLYHGNGILRINHQDDSESYYSNETLRNQSVACYFELVYSKEEDRIQSMIEELENATGGHIAEDRDRKRIQG